MAAKSTEERTVTLNYGKKDWFVTVCGLNGNGLIPGETLTEEHISKQECIDTFGDTKSNNGFKTSRNPDFIDRVKWLWKRVHQVDKPVNNDIGLHFCQGLLYEHHHGRGNVDWAEFAVTTVNWFRGTRGIRKVHDDWAHAYPSITIDVFTGQVKCKMHPRGKPHSKTTSAANATKNIHTLPSPDEGKREVDNDGLQCNSSRDIKRKINAGRVKPEYVKKHASHSLKETHTDDMPNVETSHPKFPSVEIPAKNAPDVDMSTSQSPNPEGVQTPNPEGTPHSVSKGVPKNPGPSHETNLACTPDFLHALQLFRTEIEQAMHAKIKSIEEEKAKLQMDMEDLRHGVDIATTTVKNLTDELDIAKSVLSKSPTDDNRGEVRCIESAIKSGQTKLNFKRAKYNGVSLEWRLQAQNVTEKCQAQKMLETHFKLHDEAEKMGHISGIEEEKGDA